MSTTSIHAAYDILLKSGRLLPDAAQAQAVVELDELLLSWQGESADSGGLLSKIFSSNKTSAPQGIYLWGDVGRGKSLLMDLLYDTASISPKRRVHFHAFMADVHARIHDWRERNREDLKSKDPIPPLAETLAQEAKLLCLDEFQVHDVADAMILARLFSSLFKHGVRVVFTSNRKPDNLYLHGLQRDRFLKFVELVHKKLEVHELASAEDYRLKQLKAMSEVYLVGNVKQTKQHMDEAFASMTLGAKPQPRTLDVQGHDFHVPLAHADVARFSFEDLCAKALGASDYMELAQEFNTVFIDDIPLLSPEKRNEAKRFVTLIDVLYDHKVKLICSAAALPEDLYPKGDGSFEFARTASRLNEMQSESYLAASHQVA